MRGHAFRLGGVRRKTWVVLVVVGVHALLLAVRVPPAPPRTSSSAAPPIPVVLIPAPELQPAPRVRPSSERPRPTAKAAAGPFSADPADRQQARRAAPEQPAQSSTEVPPARLGLPIDPARAPFATPPSIAEQARARSSGSAPSGAGLPRGIARATHPACKEAYAGLGLFAIPALLVDSVRDDGCRW